jgi:glycosyltransferase involved in cell wall biosynthesis
MNKRVLIYDPVPFKGGSKNVMKTILAELPNNVEVWVISNDDQSWRDDNIHFVTLFSPKCLLKQTTGALYFLKHLIFLCSLFFTLCKLKRFTKIIGLSGPCVDFALYLLAEIIHLDIIQLVQGDIAHSNIAGFGLMRANQVFYLPSTYASILLALKTHSRLNTLPINKFMPFVNGINGSTIKAKENSNDSPHKIGFLWAASLLKWKRVELFISAMAKLNNSHKKNDKYFASVCYIEPQIDAYINIDELINNIENTDNIHWYEDPKNLNDIRANSSVFISTAEDEPFGLSILEAMAAGLAIVIPEDNAYWDQHLTDGFDCIKYDPDNEESLVQALTHLVDNPTFLLKIAQQAQRSSEHYKPLHCYSQILKCIPN